MGLVDSLIQALQMAFFMFWEVLWPLALGFLLSSVVQTVISKKAITSALGKDSPKHLSFAAIAGAISSSCSYAAVSVGRGLFRKGATFTNTIAFEFASTNLVFELGIILFIILGWQFLAAEFVGGVLMIAILALIFKLTLTPAHVAAALKQANKGLTGKMEGHGEMDMSIEEGSFFSKVFSSRGLTAISHYFFMDAYSLWQDLVIGFLIAGALASWVPVSFWEAFFLTNHPVLNQFWGPIVGPAIAMVTFVCSIGNIPLAAVLWKGGISFGGVIAFIFGDLIILPIINIYRKYYGRRMSIYLLITSFAAMSLAGLLVELTFQATGLTPTSRVVAEIFSSPQWNYTSYLNLAFIGLILLMGWRFLKTGGPAMLKAMDMSPADTDKLVVDPVCHMKIKPESAPEKLEYKGKTHYFCCASCRKVFEKSL